MEIIFGKTGIQSYWLNNQLNIGLGKTQRCFNYKQNSNIINKTFFLLNHVQMGGGIYLE